MIFGRKQKPDPAQVARELRDAALSMQAAKLGLSPSEALPRVWGVLMESWQSGAVVSLAAFAEGTTSLYFSTGGGVIGGGMRENVRGASRAFLAAAEAALTSCSRTATTPLPGKGSVRFYVHTFVGLLTGEAGEEELRQGRHRLSALASAGEAVITELRLSSGEAALAQAGVSVDTSGGAKEQADARRHVESLARGIETLRRLAKQRTTYRPVEARDVVPTAVQEALAAGTRELSAQGMALLGDRMELQPDGTAVGPGRWFVDASQSVCGRFSAVPNKGKGTVTPLMMLFSESISGEFFLTGRGAAGASLAKPPNLTREHVAWSDGLSRALERHAASTALATRAGTLRRVDGIESALDLLARLRQSGSDWRSLQDADVLLDLDVRSVLGKHYDALGRQVMDFLTHGR